MNTQQFNEFIRHIRLLIDKFVAGGGGGGGSTDVSLLSKEATLQEVLTACQNIAIDADTVNLNTDTLESLITATNSELALIKANQTNNTSASLSTITSSQSYQDRINLFASATDFINLSSPNNSHPLNCRSITIFNTNEYLGKDVLETEINKTGVFLRKVGDTTSGIYIPFGASVTISTPLGSNISSYQIGKSTSAGSPFVSIYWEN